MRRSETRSEGGPEPEEDEEREQATSRAMCVWSSEGRERRVGGGLREDLWEGMVVVGSLKKKDCASVEFRVDDILKEPRGERLDLIPRKIEVYSRD